MLSILSPVIFSSMYLTSVTTSIPQDVTPMAIVATGYTELQTEAITAIKALLTSPTDSKLFDGLLLEIANYKWSMRNGTTPAQPIVPTLQAFILTKIKRNVIQPDDITMLDALLSDLRTYRWAPDTGTVTFTEMSAYVNSVKL